MAYASYAFEVGVQRLSGNLMDYLAVTLPRQCLVLYSTAPLTTACQASGPDGAVPSGVRLKVL